MILDIKQIQMASQTTSQGGAPDMQCTGYYNFLHQKNPCLHALQGNREMGARYLDPKYSRWISVDPALGEYVPQAPINDEAKKHNQNLPGMGGVFNTVNLNLFHYAGNNPVRYIDPDGRNNYDTVYTWLFKAYQFITDNASDEFDYLLVNKLTEMLNSGKIQFDDTSKRYENLNTVNSGADRYSFFDPYRNTETGERRNIIVIDPDRICENGGFPILIEVLAHEGWHAIQSDYNLISVDEDNNMYLKLGIVEIELGAYNMGRKFYDIYAEQNNLELKYGVTENWIRKYVIDEE